MYAIEINLLRGRPGYGEASLESPGASTSNVPLFIGIGVGAGLVALVIAAFGVITFANQGLAQRQQELENELAKLVPNLKKVDQLKAEEQQIQAETKALATIFNQIKPWAALLQDFRDRTPPTLQITKLEQIAPKPPAAKTTGKDKDAKAPPPPPASSTIKISGSALTFGAINDFVLALRKSPFLKAEEVKLTTSDRVRDAQSQTTLVKFEITTKLNDVPATNLLEELKRKGATGLATRIETLKQKGVLQP